MGIITAHQLVKKHRSIESILKHLEVDRLLRTALHHRKTASESLRKPLKGTSKGRLRTLDRGKYVVPEGWNFAGARSCFEPMELSFLSLSDLKERRFGTKILCFQWVAEVCRPFSLGFGPAFLMSDSPFHRRPWFREAFLGHCGR